MGDYRLGFDLGSNSIGWAILELDAAGQPCGLREAGVRIFPDSRETDKERTPLAVNRRDKRQARRQRDRRLSRKNLLMKRLVVHALMPVDKAAQKKLELLNPIELRGRGLDEKLDLYEFGRALFHLQQRRGFKSNRKADSKEKEKGAIKDGIKKLREKLRESGARTYGEYLYQLYESGKPTPIKGKTLSPERRAALRAENRYKTATRPGLKARPHKNGSKNAYDIYPDRSLLEEEFEALWDAQKHHHPELNEEARASLFEAIFHQRPLKAPIIGKCTLDPDEDRAPLAYPLYQRFRIHQDLGNMRLGLLGGDKRGFTVGECDFLAEKLYQGDNLTFKKIRTMLKLPQETQFSLESERRKEIEGDKTAKALSHKNRFGKAWHKLTLDRQQEVVHKLLEVEDESAMIAWLKESFSLDNDAAQAVADAPLPDGYGRLGKTALAKILGVFESDAEYVDPDSGEIVSPPLTYDKAVRLAGYHHSVLGDGEMQESLPYYGEVLTRSVVGTGNPDDPYEMRVGKISNATVHVALNQLRRVTNSLIKVHGKPHQIVIEVARDLKQSKEQRKEIEKQQGQNQKNNEARKTLLVEEKILSQEETPTGLHILKMKLWEELNPGNIADRRCVYTGQQISIQMLNSDAVEVEHILPFSRTYDNFAANKTVSLRAANRYKRQKSPYEAFANTQLDAMYEDGWEGIVQRAANLPKNKRWRFDADAMERWKHEDIEIDGETMNGFLARQLNDTKYISRLSKSYLESVCPNVWTTPGRLTGMLRAKLGYNKILFDHNQKQRSDHRHHAVDAVVVGLCDRGMLQKVATAAARAEEKDLDRLMEDLPPPWEGHTVDDIRTKIRDIVVSHKPDHGVEGRLHEETAYGLVKNPDELGEGYNLVYRKVFEDLEEPETSRIRDRALRDSVEYFLSQNREDPFKGLLAKFNQEERIEKGLPPVHRVRLLKKEKGVIELHDKSDKPYKAYSPGENHCIEIFELPNGKWAGEGITVFNANQPGFAPNWRRDYPDAKLVMRVHKGDFLKIYQEGEGKVMRIGALDSSANRLKVSEHFEAGSLNERHKDTNDGFRWLMSAYSKLQQMGAKRVRINEIGRIRPVKDR